MKLRTTLAVVLVAITLVVGGIVYGSFEFSKQNAIDRGQDTVDETAATVADQIETDLTERRDRVGFVASQPTASNFEETARTIDPFLENSRFYSAQILSANGTVVDFRGDVSAAVRNETVGMNLSDEPYIQRAIDGQTSISEPVKIEDSDVRIEDSDEYILIVSAPIFEAESVVGVFSAAIKLDRFTVFRAIEPLETSVQAVSVTSETETLHAGTAGFDQSAALTATTPIESTDWTVTVQRDRSGLESELRFMAIVQVASLWVVLMSIVGLATWEYRVNLSQTDRLLSGFEAVRTGLYDQRLALTMTDEWERISSGFNELTAGIRQRENAIKESEQRLEVLNRVLRHNLRNDMAVIITYADMLPELVDDPDVEMASEKIVTMGRGLTDLGTKAGKIEQAFQSVDDGLTTVDLTTIVESTVADLQADAPAADITVSMPETADVLALSTVAMAVENVCENAVEHNTAPEPMIDITVSPEPVDAESGDDTTLIEHAESVDDTTPIEHTKSVDDTAPIEHTEPTDGAEPINDAEHIRLTVADNGPGIPDQEINVLTAGRETALEHGSGLGLWLVYWLVDKSGGELHFDDSDLGGSAVSLVLPTPPHTEDMAVTKSEPATASSSGGETE